MEVANIQSTLPIYDTVSFNDWLSGRRTPHLSTNNGATKLAFQGWRHFKEAFAPELIGEAVDQTQKALGRRLTACIDPFGGSGTTALACQFLGISALTIEVNPYLADLIEAKLAIYDIDTLIDDFQNVVSEQNHDIDDAPFPGAANTFVEPGSGGRYLFSLAVAKRLATLQARITQIKSDVNRRLLLVLLGSIALPVSNVVVSGKGRRYRRGWTERTFDPEQVNQFFVDAVVRAIYEIKRYSNRKRPNYCVINGDARELTPRSGNFDIAIFSPPYPNSFDYTDVYNIELWVCGYLRTPAENKELRLRTLRSHVQIARSFEASDLGSDTLAGVMADLDSVRTRLWNRHIPSMVGAYFADMCEILDRLCGSLVSGGRVYMVVGDSRYAGVQIPVATVLAELAHARGFKITDERPFRSMRASPQQGGRSELMETLLTLTRY